MTSYNNLYWGKCIGPDKRASPLFEQLCLGLAKIICGLEPATDTDLTPARLAAFYRSVGGNYDDLFVRDWTGLSFIYSTLGCYHSLQPTASAFETPNIPALSPAGFVRWQTLQILLTPAQDVPLIQKAVSVYDVPKPDGGIFPKHIPSEAFPTMPDEEMDNWYKHVTGRLNQQNEMRRLGNSPYRSPYESQNTEYFQHNGRHSGSRAPSRPPRTSSEEDAWLAATRRRSSVPDLPTPPPVDKSQNHREGSKGKHPRSQSVQRMPNGSYQYPGPPRPTGYRHNQVPHRNSRTSSPHGPPSSGQHDPKGHGRHRSSGAQSQPRRPAGSPSTISESSGSEASSEGSRGDRKKNKGNDRRRSSLFPPESLRHHHHRRHSHDGKYQIAEQRPLLPPRPTPIISHIPRHDHQPGPNSSPRARGYSNNVRFRNDIFSHGDPSSSAPETPIAPEQIPVPRMRYDPPPQNLRLIQGPPLSRQTSGDGNNSKDRERDRTSQRQYGAPMRVNTVTGVSGRRYPNAPVEPRSAGGSQRSGVRDARTMSAAAPVGLSTSG